MATGMTPMGARSKFDVVGQTVIVAGGTRGLGRELALQLVAKGADVMVLARSRPDLAIMRQSLNEYRVNDKQNLSTHQLDLIDAPAVQGFVQSLAVAPKALICVAGGTVDEIGFFANIPAEAITNCMAKNYLSSAYIAQAILKRWISPEASADPTGTNKNPPPQTRHLVFTASTAALISIAGYAAYAPTKAAIRSLADTLRQEVQLYGPKAEINIHCSFPGTIYTSSFFEEQKQKPRLCKQIEGTLGDSGGLPTEEVARKIVSGLERGSHYVTSDLQTRLLLNNMRGPSPKDSPVVDWVLGFVVSLMWPFIGWYFDGLVRRAAVADVALE